MSLQLLVVLVPVMFGLMGFAFDLGRMYLIRGELNQAASAMALSAAGKLIGTAQSLDDANTAAQALLDDTSGHALKYNFGSIVVGQSTGLLASSAPDPLYFSTKTGATGDTSAGGDMADGTTARHVQVNLTGDAPLLFWSFLSLGQSRATPIAGQAVAGISSPVCVACGVEPFAIQAISQDDTQDFGFLAGQRYTFGYQCTGTAPAALSGTRIAYILLDRFDDTSTLDETQQLYRIGAQGLLGNTVQAKACLTIGNTEQVWGTVSGGTPATPTTCATPVPADVRAILCGLYSRLDAASTAPGACSTVVDVETLAASYAADRDVTDLDDYTAYTGNTRRVITVPVVDAISATDPMTVLGFRQFLVEPNPGDVVTNPGDNNGRFVALYIGMSTVDGMTARVPIKQGRVDGCQNGVAATAGPGKVVLHQ